MQSTKSIRNLAKIERINLSKFIHQTVGLGISQLRAAAAEARLNKLVENDYLLEQKPIFISQLADANRSKISGFYGEIHDDEASQRFGAKNQAEFSYWAWRSCGIVDLQMVLKTIFKDDFSKSTMNLIEQGLLLGGYDVPSDTGWYHQALAKIGRSYGLTSHTKKFIPSSEIAQEILNRNFVLGSMKSKMGGHLLLVYGFRIGVKGIEGFWIHDPNTYSGIGSNVLLAKSQFDKLYTRRIITFKDDSELKQ